MDAEPCAGGAFLVECATAMKITIVPVTPFRQNASILQCEETNRAALVDPGGEQERILAQADALGVRLEKILVTHGHLDHAGAVADLAEQTGLPVEGPHRDDGFWIDLLEEQGAMFGLPASRPFTPDRWLEDGDVVTVGNLRLETRHCPGHTPGHVIFYNDLAKIALVGDVLFQGSIGRTDFPRGDYDALIRSIKTRLWPLGSEVRFFPGHGPASTFGHERKTNPFVGDHV